VFWDVAALVTQNTELAARKIVSYLMMDMQRRCPHASIEEVGKGDCHAEQSYRRQQCAVAKWTRAKYVIWTKSKHDRNMHYVSDVFVA